MDRILPHRRTGPRRQEPSAEHNTMSTRQRPQGQGSWMQSEARKHFIAMSGEFVGTVMFLYFAFGATQVANNLAPNEPSVNGLMYISLAFGFSLATTAWVFYRVSGGLFNPAVSHHIPCSRR